MTIRRSSKASRHCLEELEYTMAPAMTPAMIKVTPEQIITNGYSKLAAGRQKNAAAIGKRIVNIFVDRKWLLFLSAKDIRPTQPKIARMVPIVTHIHGVLSAYGITAKTLPQRQSTIPREERNKTIPRTPETHKTIPATVNGLKQHHQHKRC
uniref:Uncharacterized protein n=1 Tax=Spongospora subterranea TaxID=70186 RepID=A0A0H5RCD9_9EUKA|eukprot:CRZ06169.1 hypothetical protein [Spongospora subterranea]